MLVSYDYEAIKNSLPLVYEYADKIVLAVDKDGKTWAGNSFTIADTFWAWIKEIDIQHKIEVYRDSFYVEGLTSLQCDTRERNMLGKYMGEGGWHVQIDADEYFVDFKSFVDFLHELDIKKKHINHVTMEWLTLYKKLPSGYLFIKEDGSGTSIATTKPNYICCRITERPQKVLYPQRIIHDSWARTEQDLLTKLNNWGHKDDFNTEGYFHYWKAINEKNYMFVHNFHPITPAAWGELDYIEANDLPSLLYYFRENKNSNLLKTAKRLPKIRKIMKLCIPPIFQESIRYIKSHTFLSQYRFHL
jgi:hypothetical protein